MTNLIKLLINISVLRAWCRKGDFMACNLCPPSLCFFHKELKTKTKTAVKKSRRQTPALSV